MGINYLPMSKLSWMAKKSCGLKSNVKSQKRLNFLYVSLLAILFLFHEHMRSYAIKKSRISMKGYIFPRIQNTTMPLKS